MHDVIRGLWVAVATPLDAAGAVDHEALVRHCQELLATGCDGIVAFATTGEGPSFAIPERLAAVEALLQAGIPSLRIALGHGVCPAIPDTVSLTRGALALGLMHALILPPYFFRDVPAQGIEDAFAAIIDGVASDRLRATLYHIPRCRASAVPAGRARAAAGALRAAGGRGEGQHRRHRERSAPSGRRRRTVAAWWAPRWISPARWLWAAPARSARWRMWCRGWCGRCSTHPGRARPPCARPAPCWTGTAVHPGAEIGAGGAQRRRRLAGGAPAAAPGGCRRRRAHRRGADRAGGAPRRLTRQRDGQTSGDERGPGCWPARRRARPTR